jgi:hypothetical protein
MAYVFGYGPHQNSVSDPTMQAIVSVVTARKSTAMRGVGIAGVDVDG